MEDGQEAVEARLRTQQAEGNQTQPTAARQSQGSKPRLKGTRVECSSHVQTPDAAALAKYHPDLQVCLPSAQGLQQAGSRVSSGYLGSRCDWIADPACALSKAMAKLKCEALTTVTLLSQILYTAPLVTAYAAVCQPCNCYRKTCAWLERMSRSLHANAQ